MLDALAQISRSPFTMLPFFFAFLFFLLAVYLAATLHRREKKADQRLKQARADITDMTILFQTMRDIIGQQKKLAREFNEELEHKMGQVKHILNQGMDKNKQLYEKQQRIAADLEEAQAQIDSLFRQAGRAQTPPPARSTPAPPAVEPTRIEDVAPPRAPAPSPIPARAPAPAPTRPSVPPEAQRARLGNGIGTHRETAAEKAPPVKRVIQKSRSAVASPPADEDRYTDTGVTKASFTSWVAEDLSAPRKAKPSAPAPASVETPLPPDTESSPTNGDAAREAFRALLNMPSNESTPRDPLDLAGQMAGMARPATPEPPENTTNGTPAMQQRVLEYSDAGMTVAEVSRELGIGKGEVRLMLSLAKQNYPPNP